MQAKWSDPVTSWVKDGISNLRTGITWDASCIGDLRGKNALVTGANSGLGYATTRKLAENGAQVFMVSRSLANGKAAAAKMEAECGMPLQLHVLECDFRELRNVVRLINDFHEVCKEPLHIFVAMAGVFYPGPYAQTIDGIETTLQVNFYAHALLTLGVLDRLQLAKGRCVMMASGFEWFLGKMEWDNLRGEKYKGSHGVAYGTSKAMKLMFARELSVRVPEVDFLGVHPGLAFTPLYFKSSARYPLSALVKITAPIFAQSPKRGCFSTLYAATEPSLTGKHFGYYCPSIVILNMGMCTEHSPGNAAVRNPAACWRLFDEACYILQSVVGPKAFDIPRHPGDIFKK